MKLWLLKRIENLPMKNDPWDPWYDTMQGFVIRAKTEMEARQIAHECGGNENFAIRETHPWKDKKYSTCIELSIKGKQELVLSDFNAA